MNQLILRSNTIKIKDGKPVTTSLHVAHYFGKEHKNILQSIENIECSREFRELNFQPSSYTSKQGKSMPMYEMTRDGFTFLVMGFTGTKAAKFKEAFILEFNRMENHIHQNQIPRTKTQILSEAVLIATEEMENLKQKNSVMQTKLIEQRPKVEAYDSVMNSFNHHPVGSVAKTLGWGPNKFFKQLRDDGILIKEGERKNIPYQKYLSGGYFVVKESVTPGGDKLTPYVTSKGFLWLEKKYNKKIKTLKLFEEP